MRKDLTILIVVMVGIMSFIVGYSMSPTEIKTCPHECCKKAGIKAKKQEKKPIVHEEKIEVKKPAEKVAPTPEKQPVEKKEVVEKLTPEKQPAEVKEEVGGYGEEIGYGY